MKKNKISGNRYYIAVNADVKVGAILDDRSNTFMHEKTRAFPTPFEAWLDMVNTAFYRGADRKIAEFKGEVQWYNGQPMVETGQVVKFLHTRRTLRWGTHYDDMRTMLLVIITKEAVKRRGLAQFLEHNPDLDLEDDKERRYNFIEEWGDSFQLLDAFSRLNRKHFNENPHCAIAVAIECLQWIKVSVKSLTERYSSGTYWLRGN